MLHYHSPFCSTIGSSVMFDTTAAVDKLNSPLVVVVADDTVAVVGSDRSSSGRLDIDT